MCWSYAYIIFSATLVWALFSTFVAVDKIYVFGFDSFIRHWTNWGWSVETAFYWLVLGFVLPTTVALCNVRCASDVAAWCFFPVNLIVWYIAMSVTILLLKDPEFITDIFASMPPGIVMVGDILFHIVPALALVFFASLFTHLIRYGLNRWCVRAKNAGCCALFCYTLYLLFLAPILLLVLYVLVLLALGTTPNEVYMTDIPIGSTFALFLVVGLIFNGIPLLILDCYYKLRTPSVHPRYDEARAMLKTDEEIFGNKLALVEDTIARDLDAHATTAMFGGRSDDTGALAELDVRNGTRRRFVATTDSSPPHEESAIPYDWL